MVVGICLVFPSVVSRVFITKKYNAKFVYSEFALPRKLWLRRCLSLAFGLWHDNPFIWTILLFLYIWISMSLVFLLSTYMWKYFVHSDEFVCSFHGRCWITMYQEVWSKLAQKSFKILLYCLQELGDLTFSRMDSYETLFAIGRKVE